MARDERQERTLAAMAEVDADVAVLTTPGSLSYAGGYDAPLELGPLPFAGGPATLVMTREGETTLVSSNVEAPPLETTRLDAIRSYEGLSRAPYPEALALMYLHELIDTLPKQPGLTVAVEVDAIPDLVATRLRERHRLVDVTEPLIRARMTKTADEIEHLRACARLVEAGQEEARGASRAGRTELAIFADIRCAIETANGARTALGGDLLSGRDRTAEVMGWPSTRCVSSGDPIICDLVPRHRGYWGDGCTTFCVDDPASGFYKLFEAAYDALELAGEVLRPGLRAGELDSVLRSVLEAHGLEAPIHMGHGIGVAIHEYPRIVPGDPGMLKSDMVLMLEPCVRASGVGGLRLESMFRVTETGNELLSNYRFAL